MSWWSSESNPAGCTEQRLVVVFPVDQAVLAIDLPEGIKIGNEATNSLPPGSSGLSILICGFFFLFRATNQNAIVPRKSFE